MAVRSASWASVFPAVLLAAGSCRDAEGPDDKSFPTQIVCIKCAAVNEVMLKAPVGQEAWPRECPSCKGQTAYAFGVCVNCGTPVPLKDASGKAYGRPETCPNCQLPWRN